MPLDFKEPHVIRATYRIVTPMFIGDAEQKASGISPASVKGALRFWWRALNWGRVWENDGRDDASALQSLHEEEAALFGTSADNGKAAQFTLRMHDKNVKYTHSIDWPNGGNDPSGYLGLGLWQSGSYANNNFQPHREYIKEGQSFSVHISASPDLQQPILQQLSDALAAWGLFGGLGSRSRRAFGSVALESLDNNPFTFSTVTEYQAAVSRLFSTYRHHSVQHAPFTALCKESRFAINNHPESNARSAHAALGIAFKNYRGQPSPLRGSIKRVFGMPYTGGTKLEGEARRASPLLFHVHPVGNKFVGALLFMPAHFHPDPALDHPDYRIAGDFLKQLQGNLMA